MRVLLVLVAALLLSTACAAPSAKPTPTPAPVSQTVAPTSTIAVPTPTVIPATSTTVPATPTATPSALVVANTGGDGVYVRKTANGDKVKAWPDGTALVPVGSDQQVSGKNWRNVKDPDGNVGWVPAEYVSVAALGSGVSPVQIAATPLPAIAAVPVMSGNWTAYMSARTSQLQGAANALRQMGTLSSQAGRTPALMADKDWRAQMTIALSSLHLSGATLQHEPPFQTAVPSGLEHVESIIRKSGGDLIYVADEMTTGLDTMQSTHIDNAVSRLNVVTAEIQQATAELNAISNAQ